MARDMAMGGRLLQRRRATLAVLLIALALAPLLTVALLPVPAGSRESRFVIPLGTWASRMAGKATEILPQEIHLTLGVSDVLVLENQDSVPQVFGPTLIMPGQRFKLPFDVASEYQFVCTAHATGQMTVRVEPYPAPGWPRLRWRVARWWKE